MRSEECRTITKINGDLPITVTKKSLRQFVIEILEEKGLLKENTKECQKN